MQSGQAFRFESGHHSNLIPATPWRGHPGEEIVSQVSVHLSSNPPWQSMEWLDADGYT